MHVSVEQVPVNGSKTGARTVKKNVLVATKDFGTGEMIYTVNKNSNPSPLLFLILMPCSQEHPIVTALDADLVVCGLALSKT
jgi:hypothetical protein